MNDHLPAFLLLDAPPKPECRAAVVVPVRNEESALPATLEALRAQTGVYPDVYEIILLLNNCTDASTTIVRQYKSQHPTFNLHFSECILPPEIAHVGTARRLLMDTACHRLRDRARSAILSTDADTTVSPDWIARNLQAIEDGAEVIGGIIHLNPRDLAQLDIGTLHAYLMDRRYQRLVAQLEDLLDHDPADPWPRHLEHFGASLACTPAIYARAGGLPPLAAYEDIAFIDACRRVDAKIRHAIDVSVVTSARLHGRAMLGLSGQLRRWKEDYAAGRPHLVQSAAYLIHRFTSLARLRRIHASRALLPFGAYPTCWRQPLSDHHPRHLSLSAFLAAIDCNRLINETFRGLPEDLIQSANDDLAAAIMRLTTLAPAPQAETSPLESIELYATPAD